MSGTTILKLILKAGAEAGGPLARTLDDPAAMEGLANAIKNGSHETFLRGVDGGAEVLESAAFRGVMNRVGPNLDRISGLDDAVMAGTKSADEITSDITGILGRDVMQEGAEASIRSGVDDALQAAGERAAARAEADALRAEREALRTGQEALTQRVDDVARASAENAQNLQKSLAELGQKIDAANLDRAAIDAAAKASTNATRPGFLGRNVTVGRMMAFSAVPTVAYLGFGAIESQTGGAITQTAIETAFSAAQAAIDAGIDPEPLLLTAGQAASTAMEIANPISATVDNGAVFAALGDGSEENIARAQAVAIGTQFRPTHLPGLMFDAYLIGKTTDLRAQADGLTQDDAEKMFVEEMADRIIDRSNTYALRDHPITRDQVYAQMVEKREWLMDDAVPEEMRAMFVRNIPGMAEAMEPEAPVESRDPNTPMVGIPGLGDIDFASLKEGLTSENPMDFLRNWSVGNIGPNAASHLRTAYNTSSGLAEGFMNTVGVEDPRFQRLILGVSAFFAMSGFASQTKLFGSGGLGILAMVGAGLVAYGVINGKGDEMVEGIARFLEGDTPAPGESLETSVTTPEADSPEPPAATGDDEKPEVPVVPPAPLVAEAPDTGARDGAATISDNLRRTLTADIPGLMTIYYDRYPQGMELSTIEGVAAEISFSMEAGNTQDAIVTGYSRLQEIRTNIETNPGMSDADRTELLRMTGDMQKTIRQEATSLGLGINFSDITSPVAPTALETHQSMGISVADPTLLTADNEMMKSFQIMLLEDTTFHMDSMGAYGEVDPALGAGAEIEAALMDGDTSRAAIAAYNSLGVMAAQVESATKIPGADKEYMLARAAEIQARIVEEAPVLGLQIEFTDNGAKPVGGNVEVAMNNTEDNPALGRSALAPRLGTGTMMAQ